MKTTLLFLSVFLSVNFFGQNVYIPDANFKACLVENLYINTNGDTEIQLSEASVFDGSIYCIEENISDLTGIEAFTSITNLDVRHNQLFNIDISQNILLETLICNGNYLSDIDLSQNTNLISLDCAWNFQLTQLDVSQNIFLKKLYLQYNSVVNLDLNQNNVLEELFCDENQISSLDLSICQNLKELGCTGNNLSCLNVKNGNNVNMTFFSTLGNPNLSCIEVDNPAWSAQYWYPLYDDEAIFSTQCNYPSDCFTSSLTELTSSKNLIQILDLMGRETSFKPNTPLIYVYDDGSIEKVFSVEY